MTASLSVEPADLEPDIDIPRFRDRLRAWLEKHSDVLAAWRDATMSTSVVMVMGAPGRSSRVTGRRFGMVVLLRMSGP